MADSARCPVPTSIRVDVVCREVITEVFLNLDRGRLRRLWQVELNHVGRLLVQQQLCEHLVYLCYFLENAVCVRIRQADVLH